jgi:hypothetical protein
VKKTGGRDPPPRRTSSPLSRSSTWLSPWTRFEEQVAPYAQEVDVALAAFGVGKGSAKMPEEEVRKIETAYPEAFCRAATAGGARACGVMTRRARTRKRNEVCEDHRREGKAVESLKFDFLAIYRPAVILGNVNTPSVLNGGLL